MKRLVTLARRPHTLVALLALVALSACTQAPPVLGLETLPNWWQTTPSVTLTDYGTLTLEFTFKSTAPGDADFTGDAGGSDPADELQLWSAPTGEAPSVTFLEFPAGTYPPGSNLSWKVVVDLKALSQTETGIAVRPQPAVFGTMGPDMLELVSARGTLRR